MRSARECAGAVNKERSEDAGADAATPWVGITAETPEGLPSTVFQVDQEAVPWIARLERN